MAIVCLIIIFVGLVVTSAASVDALTRLRLTRRTTERDSALAIAEAGADYGAAAVNSDVLFTGTEGWLACGEGSFNVVVVTTAGEKIVTSTGRLRTGRTATVQVRLTYVGGGPDFPEGAIIANGKVKLKDDSHTRTDPDTMHLASIFTNSDFEGDKKHENTVDGRIIAYGKIKNGNAHDPENPDGEQAPDLINFPSPEEIEVWRQDLIARAQAGGSISIRKGLKIDSQEKVPGIEYTSKGNAVLTAPVYIDGDLKVDDVSLTLAGGGVVYVRGKIEIKDKGAIINTGILATDERVSIHKKSAYTVSGDPLKAALVSFKDEHHAVDFHSDDKNETGLQGLVYTPNGGVKITGDGTFTGAIVAGGRKKDGQVEINHKSTFIYPAAALAGNTVLPVKPRFGSWVEF